MKKILLLGIVMVFLLAMVTGVSATGDVQIENITSGLTVDPGASVSASLYVVNMMTGPEIQYVSLVSSDLVSNNGDIITAPTINGVSNLGTTSQKVDFTVNAGTVPAGVYFGNVTATDSEDAGNTHLKAYTVTVNSVTDFTLSTSSITLSGESEDTLTRDFDITNKGSLALSNIVITSDLNLTDDDDDEIQLNFNGVPTTVAVGATEDVQVEVIIGDDVDLGEYEGTVSVTINGVTKEFDLKINVQPEICEDGVVGNLKIRDIDEPGNGDDFEIGEEIEIEVEVENDDDDDLDVIVEAILYNLDESEEIESVESEEDEVEEDKKRKFRLSLVVPGDEDLDDGDTYILYIKAYEDGDEDKHCAQDSVEIELERKKNHVVVVDTNVPSSVNCGELLEVDVEVENWGTKDHDDVFVEASIPEIGYKERSAEYELEDYEGDNDMRASFGIPIPSDIDAKQYNARFKVFYGSKVSPEETASFTVGGKCAPVDDNNDDGPKLGDASVNLVETSFEAEAGEGLSVQTEVVNNKDSAETYTVSVDGVSGWATTTGDQTVALSAGERRTVYVYMNVDDEAEGGRRSAVVNVRENGNVVASQTISVEVPEQASAGEWVKNNSTVFWIIGYIVLIIVAIILIKVLFTRPKDKNPYYTETRIR